ncbi:MAG: hypothetical protein K8L99_01080 [Anaerolineae bacterium]|nr:hypothetical protein [Anaerolineae bacterium]
MRYGYQLRAMAYYEILMMWRRGSLRLVVIGLLILPLAYILIVRPEALAAQQSAIEAGAQAATLFAIRTSLMVLTSLPLLATILVALPVLLSEVIPLDFQRGIHHWLYALPLSHRSYLFGKLLGAWVGVTAAMCFAGAVIGLAGWLSFGPFDLALWITMWSLGLLVYALFTVGLSVLLATTQPNRRRAVMIGFAIVPFVVGAYNIAPIGLFQVDALINLSALNLTNEPLALAPLPSLLTPEFIGAVAAVLLLSGLIAWYRLRRLEYT